MLDNYRNNLRYTYKMLYPGVKFSLFLLGPLVVVLIILYGLSKYAGIAQAELKIITTILLSVLPVLAIPFVIVTAYSVFMGAKETRVETVEYFRKAIKIFPYLAGFALFIIVVFLILSLLLQRIGIPFFINRG
jgi:hypothetical protein